MTDYDPYDEIRRERRDAEDADTWRERGRRFLAWLAKRPAESWMFFAVGLVLGAVFL